MVTVVNLPNQIKTGLLPNIKLLIGGVIAVCIVTACATLPGTASDNICTMFQVKGSWHKAAKKMQRKWDVPLHVPMAIMYHESGFRKKAKPSRRYILGFIPWKRRSSAYGYAQAVDGTWEAYQKDTGKSGARRTRFKDALDFMGWYIDRSSRINGISKQDAYQQYLAYHEGWTGYKQRSYKKKQWLLTVASNVDQRSQRYQTQYQGCERNLNHGFFRRLFS